MKTIGIMIVFCLGFLTAVYIGPTKSELVIQTIKVKVIQIVGEIGKCRSN